MSKNLPKSYQPGDFEERLYQQWQESGFFNPDNLKISRSAPAYAIILPPPNITDKLHIGHAATLAIEDVFIRFHRLLGERVLWLPGTDHAAIATQTVVEKKILQTEGKTRRDLGRLEFLRRVLAFVDQTQATILEQTKKIGASLDWSRLAFTLDEPRQAAVKEMFVRMYEEGTIYRGQRVVNWCVRCGSTLADDEVDYQARTAKLYTFRYAPDFPFAIATTRPETKLGDTAVAVNPADQRYKQYIGQEFKVNFCGQALTVKIIGDQHVDPAFGTGALGVTPAHSLADWQLASEHNLSLIKVIDEEGKIRPEFGSLAGLDVLTARERVVGQLKASGLLEKIEDLENNLSVCYRCGTAIEPLPSQQWFVAVNKPLARLGNRSLRDCALAAAESGQVEFLPERFSKKYTDWLKNLRDWCVSRQIWFGHPIPAWYRGDEIYVGRQAPAGDGWVADEDTLDTWFSSGMWTFSTLGWPDSYQNNVKSGDLAKFHPTQMLETGYEIITLWVSRMVMMSFFALGEAPFAKVYLHGMILDARGKKMSKSKGNGIDPLAMIKLYGADALRLSLLTGATPGTDQRFSEDKIVNARNFINKLWNISRYILSQAAVEKTLTPSVWTLADRWIYDRWQAVKAQVKEQLTNYEFSAAADLLMIFSRDELADWYVEAVKFSSSADSLAWLRLLLRELLIVWQPFMPFVTEEIWQTADFGGQLLVAAWPAAGNIAADEATAAAWAKVQAAIVSVRNARAVNKIPPANKLQAIIETTEPDLFKANLPLLLKLRTGLAAAVIRSATAAEQGQAILATSPAARIYLSIQVDSRQEAERLNKELAVAETTIERQAGKLANQEFVARAPAAIIAAERAKLAAAQAQAANLRGQLAVLKNQSAEPAAIN